jgi:hypothetical protein
MCQRKYGRVHSHLNPWSGAGQGIVDWMLTDHKLMADKPEKLKARVEKLINLFGKLDSNRDGILTESEINRAVVDPELPPDSAEVVALLKSEFRQVAETKLTPKGSSVKGVSAGKYFSLLKLLFGGNAKSSSDAGTESENVAGSKMKSIEGTARYVAREVGRLVSHELSLYGNASDPLACIKPEAARQGNAGDCLFLSVLASLAAAQPHLPLLH